MKVKDAAGMALELKPHVNAAIRAHGQETYPNECCGAMLGRDGVVVTVFPDGAEKYLTESFWTVDG